MIKIKVHIHNWVQNGVWRCTSEDHCHSEPDILDANTVWQTLGIIRQHQFIPIVDECTCGWTGEDYLDHVDTVVLYWLREYNPAV